MNSRMSSRTCHTKLNFDVPYTRSLSLRCDTYTIVLYGLQGINVIVNKCIDTCTFPNVLKLADVVPIFKKIDMFNMMNYRPISILSCISKIFEKLLISQLRMYFDDIFSQYLSGYRASYGCQDALLHFINIC